MKKTEKKRPDWLVKGAKSEIILNGEIPIQNAPASVLTTDGDVIEEAFNKVQNRNESVEVLKELFDEKKIYMITDLSQEQINIATRIYMIAKIKKLQIWQDGLVFFLKLILSKNRQSRKELLDGMRAYEQSRQQNSNPFSSWRPPQ
jgi:hypothetical protein